MPSKVTIRLPRALHREIRDIADTRGYPYLRTLKQKEEKVIIELLRIGLKRYEKGRQKLIKKLTVDSEEMRLLNRAGILNNLEHLKKNNHQRMRQKKFRPDAQ